MIATDMRRYATQYGAGRVHLARRGRLGGAVLYCTGRHVDGAFTTDESVECKACLKRAKKNGIEP